MILPHPIQSDQPYWQPLSGDLPPIPEKMQRWLKLTQSMTAQLRLHFKDTLFVQVLDQTPITLPWEQCLFLRTPLKSKGHLRRVCLWGGSTPLIYAETRIPFSFFEGKGKALKYQLDDRPIGEFLFNTPGCERIHIEVASLDPTLPLWRKAQQNLQEVCTEPMWAKRSLFQLEGRRLELIEIFYLGCSLFEITQQIDFTAR